MLVTIVALIGVLLILSPFLFSALKEGGHLKAPKFGRRPSSRSFEDYE